MPSLKHGRSTKNKGCSIEDITPYGIWMNIEGTEYFLDYENFPWFKNATVSQIHKVEFTDGFHLYWPELDVDLHIDSLNNLEKYPLIFK